MKKSNVVLILLLVILGTLILEKNPITTFSESLNEFTLKRKYLKQASDYGIPKSDAVDFYDNYPDFALSFLRTSDAKLWVCIDLYRQKPSLFAALYKASMSDPQITRDRILIAADSAELALSVVAADKHLNKASIHTIGNLTVAYNQEGLPKISLATLQLMIDVTENSPSIVDFEPIIINNQDVGVPSEHRTNPLSNPKILLNQTVVVQSKNIARDHARARLGMGVLSARSQSRRVPLQALDLYCEVHNATRRLGT